MQSVSLDFERTKILMRWLSLNRSRSVHKHHRHTVEQIHTHTNRDREREIQTHEILVIMDSSFFSFSVRSQFVPIAHRLCLLLRSFYGFPLPKCTHSYSFCCFVKQNWLFFFFSIFIFFVLQRFWIIFQRVKRWEKTSKRWKKVKKLKNQHTEQPITTMEVNETEKEEEWDVEKRGTLIHAHRTLLWYCNRIWTKWVYVVDLFVFMCNFNLMVDAVHIYNSVKRKQKTKRKRQQQQQQQKWMKNTRKAIKTSGFLMCLHFEIAFIP